MKISLLGSDKGVEFFNDILASFDFSNEENWVIKSNLAIELKEMDSNRTFLIGELNGISVATVQIIWKNADNNISLANGKSKAHVHGLWVMKSKQRNGLAFKLMNKVEDIVRDRNFTSLTLGVDDYNKAALNLYEKLGYKKFDEEPGRELGEKLFLLSKTLA